MKLFFAGMDGGSVKSALASPAGRVMFSYYRREGIDESVRKFISIPVRVQKTRRKR